MIVVAGVPTERPTELVLEALGAVGAAFACCDQRGLGPTDLALELVQGDPSGRLRGTLRLDAGTFPIEAMSGLYFRVLGGAGVQVAGRPDIQEGLALWANTMQGRVLNRPEDMASNQSKPYQAHRIRAAGFLTPETLITNDPDAARAFIEAEWAAGGHVIYKSISGVRSIVLRVGRADLDRLGRIRWCPVQFQSWVPGRDIRVHVVGQAVFATAIDSDAIDYRYAVRQVGAAAGISATRLAPDTANRCIALAEALALPLAGIDLRRTPAGDWYCFEVNPSPAFSYYQDRAEVPIARAIALYLAGEDPRAAG